jgi:hypothetical protein
MEQRKYFQEGPDQQPPLKYPTRQNQGVVGQTLTDVGDHITGVDIMKWGFYPAAVVTILIWIFLVVTVQPTVTGTSPMNVCTGNPPVCKMEEVGNGWKLWASIFVPVILGGIAGTMTYKFGFMYHNPKATAGLAGISLLGSALRGG